MRTRSAFGVGLIVFSGVLWLALPAVPLIPASNWWRGAVAGTIFVVAEIAFWVGCALAGADVVKRIRGWFRLKRAGR